MLVADISHLARWSGQFGLLIAFAAAPAWAQSFNPSPEAFARWRAAAEQHRMALEWLESNPAGAALHAQFGLDELGPDDPEGDFNALIDDRGLKRAVVVENLRLGDYEHAARWLTDYLGDLIASYERVYALPTPELLRLREEGGVSLREEDLEAIYAAGLIDRALNAVDAYEAGREALIAQDFEAAEMAFHRGGAVIGYAWSDQALDDLNSEKARYGQGLPQAETCADAMVRGLGLGQAIIAAAARNEIEIPPLEEIDAACEE